MTRNLKIVSVALVAALALSAMSASAASATTTTPAELTFDVEHDETASVDGEQIEPNNNTFRIGFLPPMTCATATFTGSAVTQGTESTEVRVTPTFETCHITLLGATKTITITPNNCHFIFNTQATQPQNEFVVTTDIDCTGGNPIELHVYNTSNHNDTGVATLCTFDVGDQEHLQGITLTNVAGAPDDILAHIDMGGIVTKKTLGSNNTCGPENNTAVYEGTGTVRGTNEAGSFVSTTISDTTLEPTEFTFGVAGGETAKVDGEQIAPNNNTFKVGALPPMTCETATFTGSAVTQGTESTEVRVTPTFETCHITLLGATKTITITPNNCHFILHAKTTQPQNEFIATTDIDCTGGSPIELHVYNTSNHNDTGVATLCTYDIGDQEHLQGITLTNEVGAPDDILAHINMGGIVIKKTVGSTNTCGPENNILVYMGTGTVRATNEGGTVVNLTVSD